MGKLRAKNIMYTQQIKHLPFNFEELDKIIVEKIQPDRWAYIVHDKDLDEDNKPVEQHIHLMMSFKNARYISSIAKHMNEKEQYYEIISGNSNNGYSYLCHKTDGSSNKYQYDPKDVKSNFNYIELIAKLSSLANKENNNKKIKYLLDALLNGDITIKDIEKTINGSIYGKYKSQIENVWSLRLKKDAEEWKKEAKEKNKRLITIYIYGEGGTGKTSLAKDIAKSKYGTYFITGSSKDWFQQYEDQRCIIIDDIRVSYSTRYEDLLKILDPYNLTSESVTMLGARYKDKQLCAEMFIITSPYSPRELYDKMVFDENDPFTQFERRMTTVIYLDQHDMYLSEYNSHFRKYIVNEETKTYNKYSKVNRNEQSISKDTFNRIVKEEK